MGVTVRGFAVRVLIFGATGMVGQGALRECLLDDSVTEVVTVGRTATGQHHPKLRDIVHRDLYDLSSLVDQLGGFDACLFCLGTSSVGKNESDYRRVTYDLTLHAAQTLAGLNPRMVFVYVSGDGTDANSRQMWARVKAATESAVIALPFQGYAIRPGYIHPMHGVRSKTWWYRAIYRVLTPLYPLLKRAWPDRVTSNEQLARAMLRVAQSPPAGRIITGAGINALAAART